MKNEEETERLPDELERRIEAMRIEMRWCWLRYYAWKAWRLWVTVSLLWFWFGWLRARGIL